MKFIVESQLLLKNLQSVGRILSPNKFMPIVAENILYEVENNKLTLVGTDLETTMVAQFELSESVGNGKVVIPYKIIAETLKTFPEVRFTFNISEQNEIEMLAGDAIYNFVGLPADEFPTLPKLENATSFNMPTKVLVDAIKKTIYATGQPDARPIMTGVLCELKPEYITFVGTDGRCLARYRNNKIQTGLDCSFVLPKKPISTIKEIFSTLDGDVRIDFSNDSVAFTIDGMYVFSKLIEGKYPNYEAVIPANNKNIMEVERLPLMQNLSSLAPFTNQLTHQIRFKITAKELTLAAEDKDLSLKKGKVVLPCSFEMENEETDTFEIGFSSKILQEILKNLDTNTIIFKFSNPTAAGLILPSETETDEDILVLAMPVMLG